MACRGASPRLAYVIFADDADAASPRRRRRLVGMRLARAITAAAIDRAGVGAFKIKSQTGTVAVEGLQSSGRRRQRAGGNASGGNASDACVQAGSLDAAEAAPQ